MSNWTTAGQTTTAARLIRALHDKHNLTFTTIGRAVGYSESWASEFLSRYDKVGGTTRIPVRIYQRLRTMYDEAEKYGTPTWKRWMPKEFFPVEGEVVEALKKERTREAFVDPFDGTTQTTSNGNGNDETPCGDLVERLLKLSDRLEELAVDAEQMAVEMKQQPSGEQVLAKLEELLTRTGSA